MFESYRLSPEARRLFMRGYEAQMHGELHDAIALYRRSLDIEESAEAHTFLGWAYSFLGRYDEAIEECRKAIELDPDYGNPYNDIGTYLLEQGHIDEAVRWLQRAKFAKRYETPEFAYCNLGRAYQVRGEWDRAIREFRKAMHLGPPDSPTMHDVRMLLARLN